MEPRELERYRALLEAKEAELVEALRRRDGIAIEKAADALDEVRLAADRELMIHTLDRESLRLREVRAALARIEEGAYGVCLGCEQPIPTKRLDAVPWAAYCVRCQEAVDAQRAAETGGSLLETLLEEPV
ncbi:MAG: TraR/DksA family transcriptional regulator [Bryobacterales bacterium]|nr:TraR/DksA family transcriptional regulator [Bryobacteraceae bacterium]MDW8131151.1 TraR/DksA family transcriptional regulator [Bryobacterales bacterium]